MNCTLLHYGTNRAMGDDAPNAIEIARTGSGQVQLP